MSYGSVITSVSIPPTHQFEARSHHYLQIESDAPIIDVPEIKSYPPCHTLDGRRRAPVPVNLRPACHPGIDAMSSRVFRDHPAVLGVMRHGMWAWADERHVSF